MKSGVAVIFNFINFNKKDLAQRNASVKDISKLLKLFFLMDMDVRVINDKNLSQMQEEIEMLSDYDFSDYEAIYLVFMSHGTVHNILYCKDGQFDLLEVCYRIFSNPTLTGKIKSVVVEACKGRFDTDMKYLADGPTSAPVSGLFEMEDVTILFSSFEGLISNIDEDGAPFIEVFREVMAKNFFREKLMVCFEMVASVFNERNQQEEGDTQAVTLCCHSRKELMYYCITGKWNNQIEL